MNERDRTPNHNVFEEPTVEGLLFIGIHHGIPDYSCNMALTSRAVGKFNVIPYAKPCVTGFVAHIYRGHALAANAYSVKNSSGPCLVV